MWDAGSRKEVATFGDDLEHFTGCAFSPDGRRLISASCHTLQVWDAETGEEVTWLIGHSNDVRFYAFSPDGRRIVSASWNELKVWDSETGSEEAALTGHSGYLTACVYSPDGRRIISASEDSALMVWDSETRERIATLTGHSGPVIACAYSPDSRWIISVSQDNMLKVWDARTCEDTFNFSGLSFTSSSLGSGRTLAVGNTSGQVYLLRLEGLVFEASQVTAVYLYRFDRRQYDEHPSVKCGSCGHLFPPSSMVLDTIVNISKNGRFAHRLPVEAWDDPRLLAECPHCHEPLRLNPFIVDNRDRS
jgi:WD40 repeat protein